MPDGFCPRVITGADFDRPLRKVQALHAVTDLIDAAASLEGVRADCLATLLAVLVEPLGAELEALAERAAQGGLKPA